MAVVKDLTGQRFGRLVAIECNGRTRNGNAKWLCKCDCGNKKVVASWGLRSGRTQSCGCIKQEQRIAYGTHRESGERKTRLYRIWSGIKTRCFNKNHKETYQKYGAKGVTMCDEWRYSYEAFRDWAQENGYNDALTIDRIDPTGAYCPENCRWATQKEQQNNRRNNHKLTFNGETHTLAEWTDLTGFGRSTIQHRLERGWSVESALQTPMRVVVGGKSVYVQPLYQTGDS